MRACGELLLRQRAQIARDDGPFGDDVVLAEGRAAGLRDVEIDFRAADHQRRVEREVRLPGQRDAERLEDARRLEDRAVADVGPEDLRRVRRLARDRQRPCRRAAAPNHRRLRVAGSVLEPDGNVRALGGSDERRPRDVLRIARCLFVSCHHDRDVHAIESAGSLQGLEGLDDDDVAALHVDCARPARAPLVEPFELLKRAVGFEHRVEVADEQKSLARPRPLCDEMPCTSEWRAIDPACGEAQGLELAR